MTKFEVGDKLTRASGVEDVYEVLKVHDDGHVDIKHEHTLDPRGRVYPGSRTGFIYTHIHPALMVRFEA